MDGWTCPFLRVKFYQLLNRTPECRTALNSHSVLLSLSHFTNPATTGLWKCVFKSFLHPLEKAKSAISSAEQLYLLLLFPVNAPWGLDLEWSWQKTQTTPDLWHTSSWKERRKEGSVCQPSFRKMDLRHGWPPGLSISTSPSLPPTRKHTQMLTLAGGNQTNLATRLFPGLVDSVV